MVVEEPRGYKVEMQARSCDAPSSANTRTTRSDRWSWSSAVTVSGRRAEVSAVELEVHAARADARTARDHIRYRMCGDRQPALPATITLTAHGTCIVTVSQAGDGTYA